MGFSTCNYDVKKLASALGVEEKKAAGALKSARTGGFARIWEVEDRGNYSVVRVSTSKKAKSNNGVSDGGYETDFQRKYVNFVGDAHDKVKGIVIPKNEKGYSTGLPIQVVSISVENHYNAEKKREISSYAIFDFDFPDSVNSANPVTVATAAAEVEDEDDDLPF